MMDRNPAFPKDDQAAWALRAGSEARMESLRNYRLSWWTHWAQLAEMFLPRRYRWFVTPNQYNKGSPLNAAIVDETGVIAARTLATGLLANLTSPNKQWFRLGLPGLAVDAEGPVNDYLGECTRRMLAVYAETNLYNSLGTAYHDNAVFGSAAVIQYEDDKDVVRFYNPCLGEFFFGLDNRLTVATLAREYTYTVQELVDEFGLDNVSESSASLYRGGGNSKDQEIVVCHMIQPNQPLYLSGEFVGLPVSKRFKYVEIYWERASAQGTNKECILRIKGFLEKPFVGLRWDVTSNDPYGRSPGMDALPAVRQLQIEQRRKAEAIDKLVRPPMVGSVSMKNEPASILPGGITYTADPAASGFKPAFTVDPRIQEMTQDILEVQQRVDKVFFVPLFTGISDLQTVRTATEIDARIQEKLVMLGPVVERTENEGLDDILARTFAIMQRRGMFPDSPPEMQGQPIEIQYISILAEAQAASQTAAIERTFAFAGNLAGVYPEAVDNLDVDQGVMQYGDKLNIPPRIVRGQDAKLAIRKARADQLAQQQHLNTGTALAAGAKTLSETDVGGGQNALQSMLQ